MLAYLVRGDTGLVRLDDSVANWGDRHAAPFSTDALNVITTWASRPSSPSSPPSCALAETVRIREPLGRAFLAHRRRRATASLTTTVKHLADRVRPAVNPVAETLGPSFPSGHSSWSAAFFAAAALLLGRGPRAGARGP